MPRTAGLSASSSTIWGPGGVLLSHHQGRVFRWNQGPPIANGELWICYWLLCNWLTLPYVTHAANKVPRANTDTGRCMTNPKTTFALYFTGIPPTTGRRPHLSPNGIRP
ncbi:hypothetical protein BKA59DRAFT_448782 [Fusarium tricinctum]|uniref:Uncharacterized protein n=1 Tax=Fusarium tricinctum TaxID=61284 RepID=A0A8K0WI43_9HYPO|nr:hypothetical protein BKA59DRAFT_448782 [Fusarium tricinctum]